MSELERSRPVHSEDQDAARSNVIYVNRIESEWTNEMAKDVFRLCVNKLRPRFIPGFDVLALYDKSGSQLDMHIVNEDSLENGLYREEDRSSLDAGHNAVSASLQSLHAEIGLSGGQEAPGLPRFGKCAVPVVSQDGHAVNVILLYVRAGQSDRSIILSELNCVKAVFECCSELIEERQQNMRLSNHLELAKLEIEKREVQYNTVKKLHSLIDKDRVLTELVDYVKKLYPNARTDIFVAQDRQTFSSQVKPLILSDDSMEICTRAFLEGRIVYDTSGPAASPLGQKHASQTTIAVPLSGKQGVYGVMRLMLGDESPDSDDIRFLSRIARTAGTALENAILYEQSNMMITELRLINEMTKRLNQSLRLNEIFYFAITELIRTFGADCNCSIVQMDNEKEKLVVQASSLPKRVNEVCDIDYGFTGVIYKTKEPVILSDYENNQTVSSKFMEETGSRSLIASPILASGEVVGVILVAHRNAHFFTYNNYKLLQVLSGHIGLAIANASLHAEVRRMAIMDNLTGLYVRHYLDEQVNLHQASKQCGSLILVDVDHFKEVNDTYGHQIGDKILKSVSHIIKTSIRESDIAARWGGEELAVYLPRVTAEQAVHIAERIRTRVLSETEPAVTVSCGVSDWNWQDGKISVESLFYKADMALYEVKNTGRNQVKIG